jgi:RHS repeat-associated protein
VNNRDNNRTQNFVYDSLNRIKQAYTNGSNWGEQYTIDTYGNLTNIAPYSGKSNSESLNCAPANTRDQLSTCFGYDAAGNLTSNGTTGYSYDGENHLIGTGTSGMSYIYDGDGQRVEKCNAGSTPGTCATNATGTLYWSAPPNNDPAVETDLTGNVLETYVFFNGRRIARREPGTPPTYHFYFSDHLGSHNVVTNASGSSCEQDIDYYPYGGVEQDYCGTVGQHYKFTGTERDSESGLDSFGKRFYGSTMGRWMSPDLVNVTQDRVVNPANTLNKYVYGGNNPLKYIDPDGQDITYFYDPGFPAGHAVLFAYNQATGDSAIESFGPKLSLPVWTGESKFHLDEFTSAQGLRDNFAALTIQTSPELTQQVIDYIRANPDPSLWTFAGPNCSSEVAKILKQFKLDNQSRWRMRQGATPKILWHSLMSRYNASQNQWGSTPNRGQDYGNPRYDMFKLLWLSLPQSEPKATVTTITTNCLINSEGEKTCTTF